MKNDKHTHSHKLSKEVSEGLGKLSDLYNDVMDFQARKTIEVLEGQKGEKVTSLMVNLDLHEFLGEREVESLTSGELFAIEMAQKNFEIAVKDMHRMDHGDRLEMIDDLKILTGENDPDDDMPESITGLLEELISILKKD